MASAAFSFNVAKAKFRHLHMNPLAEANGNGLKIRRLKQTAMDYFPVSKISYFYPMNHPVLQWYAAYTHSRAEKRVALELEKQGIEYFLPLIKTLKQWSDRKKKVEEPLIRSYIFVRITEKDYRAVLQTTGIVTIVHFSGKPVPVPEWQINNLKILMGSEVPIEQEMREFTEGEEVRINRGTLLGLRGVIVQLKGRHKMVISIHALHYHLTIDIDPMFVEGIK